MMRTFSLKLVAALIIVLGSVTPGAMAKGPKHSAEHVAAIKKCNEDYKAATVKAKTVSGIDRQRALAHAKASRKQCIASAPK
jgi:hypothetical protein